MTVGKCRFDDDALLLARDHYSVAGQEFDIDDQVFRLLADHFELGYPQVTIYFTPVTRQILALKILGMEQTALQTSQHVNTRKETPQPQSIWRN